MERILAKLVALSKDLTADQSLELVFDGRTEHLTFYKVTFVLVDTFGELRAGRLISSCGCISFCRNDWENCCVSNRSGTSC